MRFKTFLVVGCLALGLPLAASAQAAGPDPANGEALYFSTCAVCHDVAPNIMGGARFGANNPALIESAIKGGISEMAILDFLSTSEIADIAAYLGKELGAPPQPLTGLTMASCLITPSLNDLWLTVNEGGKGWTLVQDKVSGRVIAVEYTHGAANEQIWLLLLEATCESAQPIRFSGKLYRTSGPPFFAQPYNNNLVATTEVGSATFTFTDGNNASVDYTASGRRVVKAITRLKF